MWVSDRDGGVSGCVSGQRDQEEIAGGGERVSVEVHDRDGVIRCVGVCTTGDRREVVGAVADAAADAWTARGREQFRHGEVDRCGGKVEGAADVVVVQVSSDDAHDIVGGKAEAGELLDGGIGAPQTGAYRPQCLSQAPDGVGDVLLSEADVDEDQAVIELEGKDVGDALRNAHRCEGSAVEVVNMTNRSDLWEHRRKPILQDDMDNSKGDRPGDLPAVTCLRTGSWKARAFDQFSEPGGGLVTRCGLGEVAAKCGDTHDLVVNLIPSAGDRCA